MAKTRRDAAPNQEWVLMYRGGLARGRIADLVGAAPKTVDYHLRIALAGDPGLQAAHDAAAAQKTTHAATVQGLERMRQLVALVQETGRYPSRTAESTAERTLATWLQRRREDARAGTLAPAYCDGLSVLNNWITPPRAEADDARWQERLKALTAYRDAGNDWPRHKAVITGEEHELGVWLHIQRSKLRKGELDPAKALAPDEALPGWREGRRRGRKSHELEKTLGA
ncbi:helicase associated domain-containing protein [Arthrobacter sp. ISL-28]|uniref:helicase associated domain-containing protein n=1 Tax=Arthrobacter sp. ISL-28 TaxID=2819108 RepID=UPI00288BEA39|nr:helicase associated domain-containing protein [Arthrobacter sp. ISL-28]